MTDTGNIEKEIENLRMEQFVPWRSKHDTSLAKVWSPPANAAEREQAFKEVANIYDREGREYIQDTFSRMIGLRSALAKEQGTKVTEQFFHHNDGVANGIVTIQQHAGAVLDRYLGFKAKLLHKDAVTLADMSMPVGDWGKAQLSWDQTLDIVTSAFGQVGLSDIARTTTDNQGGAGSKFWNDFAPRLKQLTGLTGVRLSTHEMGHALHYELAKNNFNDNPELAEIVSIFAESLFMKEMGKRASSPQQNMAALSNQLDADIQYVGQVEKLVFERSAYEFAEAHPDATIPVEKLWNDAGKEMFGETVDPSEENNKMMNSRLMMWDQYIHGPPGYGSGYLIGWAAAPKLMEKLEADPEGFKQTFREMLQKGGNISADQFLQAFDVDMNQPEFWQDRLHTMDRTVDQLEQAHREYALSSFVNPATHSAISRFPKEPNA